VKTNDGPTAEDKFVLKGVWIMKESIYLRANSGAEATRQRRTFGRMLYSHEQFFRLVESRASISRDSSVLEMACGCGLMANEAQLRWGCRTEGWDNNASYIETARHNFPRIKFKKIGFMDNVPTAKNIDLIIFREALMECQQPDKVLKWSAKLMGKGGWISALEPDYGATIMYPEMPCWQDFLEKYGRYCKNKGENFFMGRALLDSFQRAGLRKISVQPICEINTCLDPGKFSEFVEIEAFSIEADMAYFAKHLGLSTSHIKKTIDALRQLPKQKGAYLQTMMVAICGQV